MIKRFLIAGIGALVITTGLLLAMETVTSLFRAQSGERFFRITDILPKPPPGRPERPQVLTAPERVEPEVRRPEASLPLEMPSVGRETPPLDSPALERPELDERE